MSQVVYSGSTSGSRGGGNGGGALRPVGDWNPPACWYEPRSAEQFRDYVESMYEETVNTPGQHSYAKQSAGMFRDDYKDGTYKNYNLDKKDEGSFWVAVRDEDRWMEPEAQACDKAPFWVENGDPVPVENAVTPEVLAELAYNRVRLAGGRGDPQAGGCHQGESADLGVAGQGQVQGDLGDRLDRHGRAEHPGDHHGQARLPEAGARHAGRRDVPRLG